MSRRNNLIGDWFNDLAINKAIIEKDGINNAYFNKLEEFAYLMQEKLDQHSWYVPVAYTPHDFSHHIKNVLENASKLLAPVLKDFSLLELVALQYACILHDIDMIYNPFQREIHGCNAASILLTPFRSKDMEESIENKALDLWGMITDLGNCGNIPDDTAKHIIKNIHDNLSSVLEFHINNNDLREAIGWIIFGHSDIKLSETDRINTLDKTFYEELYLPHGNNTKNMQIRTLAAVLRLADELDCSRQRKEGIPEPILPPEARKYWDRLDIITSVIISPPRITLRVNCSHIQHSPNRMLLFSYLKEVVDKIEQERALVMQCFVDDSFSQNLAMIKLDFVNKTSLESQYNQYCDEEKKN